MADSNDGPLDAALRASLRTELVIDREKGWHAEWARVARRKRELIDQYGIDVIPLTHDEVIAGELIQCGEFPDDCPWAHLNGCTPSDAIRMVFGPIAERLPDLVVRMSNRCRLVFAERHSEGWRLHYLLYCQFYDGSPNCKLYTGGPPEPRPIPTADLIHHGWDIPADLREFYAIHDGFGDRGFGSYLRVPASTDLEVMATSLPLAELDEQIEERKLPRLRHLLSVYGDGVGNHWCFLRTAKGARYLVWWDHEGPNVKGPYLFFDVIDMLFSQLDEE